jgi:hypothetical protein
VDVLLVPTIAADTATAFDPTVSVRLDGRASIVHSRDAQGTVQITEGASMVSVTVHRATWELGANKSNAPMDAAVTADATVLREDANVTLDTAVSIAPNLCALTVTTVTAVRTPLACVRSDGKVAHALTSHAPRNVMKTEASVTRESVCAHKD